jgi:Peptide methionine sulfoxide reductase
VFRLTNCAEPSRPSSWVSHHETGPISATNATGPPRLPVGLGHHRQPAPVSTGGCSSAATAALFQAHDPTTKNRQGNDVGTSYRSAIFFCNDQHRQVAEETIADVDASGLWPGKVVTEVTPAGPFWEAEPEHQDYLERNPGGYTCHYVRPNWKLPHRSESAR